MLWLIISANQVYFLCVNDWLSICLFVLLHILRQYYSRSRGYIAMHFLKTEQLVRFGDDLCPDVCMKMWNNMGWYPCVHYFHSLDGITIILQTSLWQCVKIKNAEPVAHFPGEFWFSGFLNCFHHPFVLQNRATLGHRHCRQMSMAYDDKAAYER